MSRNEQSDSHEKWLRQEITAYLRQRAVRRPPAYCGHAEDRARLEAALWSFCEGQIAEDEHHSLWDHAKDCDYCLHRIAGIVSSLSRPTSTPAPSTAPAASATWPEQAKKRKLALVLRRIQAGVQAGLDRATRTWLEPLETSGQWLRENVDQIWGSEPSPALAGGLKGSGEDTANPPLTAHDQIGAYDVYCKVQVSPQDRLELQLLVRTQAGKAPAISITAKISMNGQFATMRPLDAAGKLTLPIAKNAKTIDIQLKEGETPLGEINVNLEDASP